MTACNFDLCILIFMSSSALLIAGDPPNRGGGMPERCRFWPNCKNGDSCPYHHPSAQCRYASTMLMYIVFMYTYMNTIRTWVLIFQDSQ